MPSLSLPDRFIWFAHCPKAGGTSVEQIMVAAWGKSVGHLHWGWDLWWRDGGWRLADPPSSPQHLTWEDACRVLPRTPDAVFALVRDPVARMASEHRWQRRGRRGTRSGKALAWLPFPVWLRLMLAVRDRNPHAFDNHFRPQCDFVPEGAAIFRLEEGLEPVLDWLKRATGNPALPDLPPHALPTGKSAPMTARDKALISQVFEVDYFRFGYSPPDPAYERTGYDFLLTLLAPLVAAMERRGRL